MLMNMSDCPARTWLAIGFMSIVGFLIVVLLLVAIAALGRYVRTGVGSRRDPLR